MLFVYSIEQFEQWDAIVRSFQNYDTYWLSGYVKAFQIHGDGEPFLIFYEDQETRGINVVMKRDIAKDPHFQNSLPENRYFDFSSPYGYGGWIIEGQKNEPLFAAYEQWCKNHEIVSEFVRFHPVLKNHVPCEKAYEIVPLGNTVCLDLTSPDVIWNNISSKNRNMIRKAEKNGVKIYNGRYPEIFETFRAIYNETMDKDSAEPYYYFESDFYKSICEDLPQNAQVFYAELDGKIIAASIMLAANGRMNYHLSGSVREYATLAPTNLLLYQAALWGSANGCQTLYLGGGVGSGEDGLYRFKKSFYRADDLNQFHIGKKIFFPELYDELCSQRNIEENTSFFPQYRVNGN